MKHKTSIGFHIQRLRKRSKLSQSAFSRKCGLSQAQLSRIEASDGNPTIDTLFRIASAAGADLHIEFKLSKRR